MPADASPLTFSLTNTFLTWWEELCIPEKRTWSLTTCRNSWGQQSQESPLYKELSFKCMHSSETPARRGLWINQRLSFRELWMQDIHRRQRQREAHAGEGPTWYPGCWSCITSWPMSLLPMSFPGLPTLTLQQLSQPECVSDPYKTKGLWIPPLWAAVDWTLYNMEKQGTRIPTTEIS